MPLNVKVSGTWRQAAKVMVRIAGSWLTAKELFAYAEGGWKSSWKNEITYINTSNRTGANIYTLMGSPTQPGTYVFENQATISAGAGNFALRTGVFPAGSILKIVNKGYIRGRGGAGGPYTGPGTAGSTALYLDMPCAIDTASGFIYGGGGGGGGAQTYNSGGYYGRAGGGGGAGTQAGLPGTGTVSSTSAGLIAVDPAEGGIDAGGQGGRRRIYNSATLWTDTNGGAGGGLGSMGATGFCSKGSGTSVTQIGYAGGAAGAAILSNGNTVSFIAGNNTTQVRGAVV